MASVFHAAVAASVVVGMASLPAVSEAPGEMTNMAELPEEAGETSMEVVRSSSPDGFEAEISTTFQNFVTSVGASSANASLTSSQSELQMESRPQGTRWRYTSPHGEIVFETSSAKSVERVTTPEGTLETVQEKGDVTESFEGSDREKVEELAEHLRSEMESAKQDFERKRQEVRPKPDINLISNASTGSGFGDNDYEHVVIVNEGDVPVDLEPYELRDETQDSFDLPPYILEPGESVKIYTWPEEQMEEPDQDAIFDSGVIWVDTGDTSQLVRDEEVVVEESY